MTEEKSLILDLLDELGNVRRMDGEFTWREKKYKYTAYTIVPTSGSPVIRIDIKEL